ncbi:solute carrier family 22 member 3 isoform X2 [Phlebotomus argentipes]|uniref:solute carrier family 22 member 3 isoform X2 n=1 Tax=Phlebotomus argentipes TaxID=94469 RepID=UPI002892CDCC|nr:solute carrier family 22 member 3 isoform X2 [Phlebotomus argentipes]
MDFDRVLDEIGEFGKFQLTNYLLICLPVFFGAANSLSYVFTAGVPNYRCFVPNCDDPIDPIYDESWIDYAVPGSTDSRGIFTPEQCQLFVQDNSTLSRQHSLTTFEQCPPNIFTSHIEECNQWVFDQSERTIVQEWDITCMANHWKLSLVGTMHFLGIVSGSFVFGVLADRYGRKIVLILSILFMSITGIGQALSGDYITFIVFAYLNAVGTSGVYPLAFILGVEMVGKSKREMSGNVLNYFYALGEASVGLVAWLSGNWMIVQLAVSAPPLLFALYYWIVPESVRWLLAKKHTHKAGKIIKRAAKINGVVLSDSILATFDDSDDNDMSDSKEGIVEETDKSTSQIAVMKEAFKSKTLMIRFAILIYNWITNAFVYYGLSLNSTSLSGNKYLNYALVCLIEIPGYTLAWIAMNKIGRRWSLSSSLLLCAVTCVLGGFIDAGELTLFFNFCLAIYISNWLFCFSNTLSYS